MDINLIRSLTSNSYMAFFEGDMSADNQQRAITWFKDHQISGVTIGWAVSIDRNTGALAPFADSVQQGRSPQWGTFSVSDMEGFAKLCTDNGLTVTLKPYFVDSLTTHNIAGYDDEWAQTNVEAVKTTMANYLLQTADMAQRTHADALVIGTENTNLSTDAHPQFKPWWDSTIADIRARFGGLLTYAEVTWPHSPNNPFDVDNVSFASKLDFIGLDLYPPVTASTTPSYAEAVAGWTNNLKAWWSLGTDSAAPASINLLSYLQGLNTKFNLPVVLTETGYPATDGAGARPFQIGPVVDAAEQALLLQAEFDVVKNLGNWFGGLLMFSDDGYHYSANYAKGNGALVDATYSVVGRAATDVVSSFMSQYQHPLLGGTGNDNLTDVAGDNVINGGAGVDTLLIPGKRSDYTLTLQAGRYVLKATNGDTDILKGVERLVFTDSRIAYDMDGNAGKAAELLGAILGIGAVKNPGFAGVAINLLDQGMTMQQVAELGLGTSYFLQAAGTRSNTDVVKTLYKNIFGADISAADLTQYVGLLDGKAMTQAGLAVVAAQSSYNTTHIDLIGLASTGLDYL